MRTSPVARVALASLATAYLALTAPAQATAAIGPQHTTPVDGTFTLSTAPGVLPTLALADISLVGVSPGEVRTSANNVTAEVTLPVVAQTRSAYAMAGGFRLINTDTNAAVRCQVPTVDTQARVVTCVLTDTTTFTLFTITDIAARSRVRTPDGHTRHFRGMTLKIYDANAAARLNDVLDTNAFSDSVTFATAELLATEPTKSADDTRP